MHSFRGDQEKVYKSVMEFIDQPDGGMCLIEGIAGTGKTKVVSFVVQTLIQENRNQGVSLIAPTGQAVKVMRESADYDKDMVRFSTIHSLFKLIPKKESEELTFIKSPGPCDADFTKIFFVDEASQLEDTLFFYLLDQVEEGDKKVIFIGDGGQTPPIKYNYSIPFTNSERDYYDIEVFKLEKPIRQNEGNPILDLGAFINSRRKRPLLLTDREDDVNSLSEGVEYLDYEGDGYDYIYDLIEDYFLTDEYKKDHNLFKILAWRNNTVDVWNKRVRKMLYKGQDLKKLMVGEIVLSMKPELIKEGDQEIMVYSTNEELTIESYKLEEYAFGDGIVIRYYETVVSFLDGYGEKKTHVINIVHERSEKQYQRLLQELADYAKEMKNSGLNAAQAWGNFWEFKDAFAEIRYNYARTVHTAQGTSYNSGIVMEWDIMSNNKVSERNRIMYTALTRFSKKAFVAYSDNDI